MPFCANCGISVSESDKFCKQCGAPRDTNTSVLQPPISPSINPHKVITMLPQAKKMKLLGLFDTYTVIFTLSQTIVAKLSGEVVKDVVKKSQEKSKADGKGWLGRVGDQMKAFGNAHLRYLELTPDQILAETPGNFAFDHRSVSTVIVKQRFEAGDEDGPGDPYVEVEFVTPMGKYKYRVPLELNDVLEMLNNFYAGKIKR